LAKLLILYRLADARRPKRVLPGAFGLPSNADEQVASSLRFILTVRRGEVHRLIGRHRGQPRDLIFHNPA